MTRVRERSRGLWWLAAGVIAVGLLAARQQSAHAWWSVMAADTSTHLKIGKAAMDLLDQREFPDLARFRDLGSLTPGGIQAWMSGPTDDENAHGKKYRDDAGKFDGGPVLAWWGIDDMHPDDGILPQHKAFNFLGTREYGVYYYLALLGHLVGDQAVPAHAANIFHLQPVAEIVRDPQWGDNFEHYAYERDIAPCGRCHATPPIAFVEGLPVNYYHSTAGSLEATQRNLPGWRDHRGNPYWTAHPAYVGEAFDDNWGHYGPGATSPDTYVDFLDPQNLIQRQFKSAVFYTAGVLRSVSKSLPPLVKDLAITYRTLDPTFEANIRFTLMENRTSEVAVTLRAVSADDSFLLSLGGETWNSHPVHLWAGAALPFERAVEVAWKGYGRSEKTGRFVVLPDGDYRLMVFAADADGNEVNAVYPGINSDTLPANDTARPFRISTQPPDTPSAFTASGNDSSVRLSWVAPTTSLNGSALPDLAGYRLWRRDDTGGACSGPSDSFHQARYCRVAGETTLSKTTTSYLDRSVATGVTYTYVLEAVDAAGKVSPPTEGVAARPFPAAWVPSEYPTIAQALAAAQSGEVVMVRPGTYRESRLVVGQGAGYMSYVPRKIVLMSERGPATTIIEGGGTNFLIQASDSTAIIGFTLRNNSSEYGAIKCFFDDDVLVANNIFVANRVAVYAGGTEGTRVYNNTFAANTMAVEAGFLGRMDVRNNIFAHNGTAAGIAGAFGRATVAYNDFFGNGTELVRHLDPLTGGYDDTVAALYTFDPEFVSYSRTSPASADFRLRPGSPAIDRGDPDLVLRRAANVWLGQDLPWVDADGTRADLGAFGGPFPGGWASDDHDADGIPDSLDADDDNDCLADNREDGNGNGIYEPWRGETNPLDADSDDDGLTDGNCGSEDLNADGVWEPGLGETDPRQADSDGDGIPDGTEKGLAAPEGADTDLAAFVPDLDPATTTDPLNPDTDGDGLPDGTEDADRNGRVDAGETDPGAEDTDGDGYPDGEETARSSDPLDPGSVPNHAPEIRVASVAQRRDGSGLAEIVFAGADAEGDACALLSVEVSRDGETWSAIEPRALDPLHTAREPLAFSPSGAGFTFVWDVRAALGDVEDGEVFVRLRAADGVLAGDPGISPAFAVDTQPPRVEIRVPSLSSAPVTPVVTAGDGIDPAPHLSATLDGAAWPGGAIGAEGLHTLRVTATDRCGNRSAAEARFTVDRTPPSILFQGVADGGVYGSAVTVSWEVRDALDPAATAAGTFGSPHTFAASGWHTVQVTASDAAGNAASRSCSFGVFKLADLATVLAAMDVDAGVRNSLRAKLENAQAARDRGRVNAAVNLLEAFIHAVDAHSGKKIAAADAARLVEFAGRVVGLLRSSWGALSLGEVVVAGDDPALAAPAGLVATLERHAVSRVVLELHRIEGRQGSSVVGEALIDEFLAAAERAGITVFAGMQALAAGIDPAATGHRDHLAAVATGLLDAHPTLEGVVLTNLEAAGRPAAVTALAAGVRDAVRTREARFGVRVACPSGDLELTAQVEAQGQDLLALGAIADSLYLDAAALHDADFDGIPDRDPTWTGAAVAYVASLGLPADLVVVVPTADLREPFDDRDGDGVLDDGEPFADLDGDGTWGVMLAQTPERIGATVSSLSGALIGGVAVCRNADTSAAEWAAFLNSSPTGSPEESRSPLPEK